jgi:3-oxoacyl-[acyl-carrier-protein] synthase II
MNAISGCRSCSFTDEAVITGLGAVCSLGNSIEEITRRFMSGESGIGEISDFNPGEFRPLAARAKNPPEIKTDIHPELARSMGKHLSLLLASTDEALCRAGIGAGMFDPRDIGFFAGMGMVDYRVEDLLSSVLKAMNRNGSLDYDRFFAFGYQEIYPLWPLGMLNNVAFCQASIHFGLRGENCVFSPHGDAGIRAVAEAVEVLKAGKAKMTLAGGVSEEVSPLSIARAGLHGLIGPSSIGAGHACDDLLDAQSEVFLGECGAMLVLEPLTSARERGAEVLARIAGLGFACEKDPISGFASRRAIAAAIGEALSHAALRADQIDLVMTGSFNQNELKTIQEIFGGGEEPPVVASAAKTMGEMLAAGPILSIALGLSVPGLAALPLQPSVSIRRFPSSMLRMLVNGISYEGRCASIIIEKTSGEPV